jgi:hypothetical protein
VLFQYGRRSNMCGGLGDAAGEPVMAETRRRVSHLYLGQAGDLAQLDHASPAPAGFASATSDWRECALGAIARARAAPSPPTSGIGVQPARAHRACAGRYALADAGSHGVMFETILHTYGNAAGASGLPTFFIWPGHCLPSEDGVPFPNCGEAGESVAYSWGREA